MTMQKVRVYTYACWTLTIHHRTLLFFHFDSSKNVSSLLQLFPKPPQKTLSAHTSPPPWKFITDPSLLWMLKPETVLRKTLSHFNLQIVPLIPNPSEPTIPHTSEPTVPETSPENPSRTHLSFHCWIPQLVSVLRKIINPKSLSTPPRHHYLLSRHTHCETVGRGGECEVQEERFWNLLVALILLSLVSLVRRFNVSPFWTTVFCTLSFCWLSIVLCNWLLIFVNDTMQFEPTI